MPAVRPKIAELVFHLYARPLHPELFEFHQTRKIERGDYEAKVQITSAGHLVTWRAPGITLTEVAAAAYPPLPEKRRLLSYRLRGESGDRIDCRGLASYEVKVQLEAMDPEFFWGFQQELIHGPHDGMLQVFDASGRVAFGAISYIHVESRARSLRIQAFHTFPDDRAIVKSQSWFRLP